LRFGGENGDVPEFVRQNCPLKGFRECMFPFQLLYTFT
jgi:hypothetical protein